MSDIVEFVDISPNYRIKGGNVHWEIGDRRFCMPIHTFRLWLHEGQQLLREWEASQRPPVPIRRNGAGGHAAS